MRCWTIRILPLLWAGFFSCGLWGQAVAAQLSVAPMLLELPPQQQSTNFWLTNDGVAPVQVQLRVMRWSQANAVESLEPSTDVVASPPLVTIAPGVRQLVRIVQRPTSTAASSASVELAPGNARAGEGQNKNAQQNVERAYRLIVDEVPAAKPGPAPAEVAGAASTGLQFVLRMSIPLFVLPTGAIPELEQTQPRGSNGLQTWLSAGEKPGEVRIHARNDGPQRQRFSGVEVQTPGATGQPSSHTIVEGLLGYVLPGAQMQWDLALPSSLSLTALQKGQAQLAWRLNNDDNPTVLQLGVPPAAP